MLHGGHVFLLSHMRSYSSVFGHILGSHPEICGHSERQRGYADWWALFKLRTALAAGEGSLATQRWFLDKILHNRHRLGETVLNSPRVRLIFFVRRPESTLASIVRLGRREPRVARYADAAEAAGHYLDRLEGLVEVARLSRCPLLFFEAEDFETQLETVLERVGDWLGLHSPLSPSYRVFSDTGQAGAGDSSENIRKGRFMPHRGAGEPVAIDPTLLRRCEEGHAWCVRRLAEIAAERGLVLRSGRQSEDLWMHEKTGANGGGGYDAERRGVDD
ncbi:MAG: hypothetical protein D6781_13040 [Verrucomicrobia bacterium]|nr:MAG: hypothetical protein D6781_13040 [Verrucomicrobiota bacterium]